MVRITRLMKYERIEPGLTTDPTPRETSIAHFIRNCHLLGRPDAESAGDTTIKGDAGIP